MNLLQVFLLMGMPVFGAAFNLFKVAPEAPLNINGYDLVPELLSSFDPKELLDTRKPDLYTIALHELGRLKEAPVCHRLAAQLLIDSCHSVKHLNEQNMQLESQVDHHVESFANGLTMCDMERAQFDIPEVCQPFTSSALQKASQNGKRQLDVSSRQVGECRIALSRHHSNLLFWVENRKNALLFCRAVRLEMDKDYAIRQHSKLAEVLEEFTGELQEDLKNLNQNMKSNTEAAASIFHQLWDQAAQWKFKVDKAFGSVSRDVQDVQSTLNLVIERSNDAKQNMESLVRMVIGQHVEMVREHQNTLAITTKGIELRMGDVNEMVEKTEDFVSSVYSTLKYILPMVVSLGQRQDALEQSSKSVLSYMMNATELLQSHAQILDHANSKASRISENLDKAASAADSWMEGLSRGQAIPDSAFRVSGPLISVALRGWGQTRSILRNIEVVAVGYLGGECVVQLRHWFESQSLMTLGYQYFFRPAFVQSTKDHPKSWSKAVNDSELSLKTTNSKPDFQDRPIEMIKS